MREDFLYFLWQSQYFDKTNLTTTQGEVIEVKSVGQINTDAGPDFTNARLWIDGVEWAGTVEMHLKSSDWHRHAHTNDRAYGNVILHVVWQDDQPITRPDATPLPTLELSSRTDILLLQKYQSLTQQQANIACGEQFEAVPVLTKISMLDRVLTKRLERKSEFVQDLHHRNHNDWEETAYQLLAHTLGFKINAEPFLRLAEALPFKILQKHRDNLTQIEAMLLGQAGFLEDIENPDDYTATLLREYRFLSVKYDLKTKQLARHEWKFLRLRPANFPTLRLAQFAALLHQYQSLFSWFTNEIEVSVAVKKLRIKTSDYWHTHYQLGVGSDTKVPSLGRGSAEGIIINTVVPLLVAYAKHKDNDVFLGQALRLIEGLPAEHNHITDEWEQLGLKIKTAYDSQAVIELYNNFCTLKKCLNCTIGAFLLKNTV
jgi:Protein of unknown function (DUF2851)